MNKKTRMFLTFLALVDSRWLRMTVTEIFRHLGKDAFDFLLEFPPLGKCSFVVFPRDSGFHYYTALAQAKQYLFHTY